MIICSARSSAFAKVIPDIRKKLALNGNKKNSITQNDLAKNKTRLNKSINAKNSPSVKKRAITNVPYPCRRATRSTATKNHDKKIMNGAQKAALSRISNRPCTKKCDIKKTIEYSSPVDQLKSKSKRSCTYPLNIKSQRIDINRIELRRSSRISNKKSVLIVEQSKNSRIKKNK